MGVCYDGGMVCYDGGIKGVKVCYDGDIKSGALLNLHCGNML